jgi:hypothetical protein
MIENVILHKPFSVSFTHERQRYVYLIDSGGLRQAGEDILHETPTGSINLSHSTFAEAALAAHTLGARLSITPHVREGSST